MFEKSQLFAIILMTRKKRRDFSWQKKVKTENLLDWNAQYADISSVLLKRTKKIQLRNFL